METQNNQNADRSNIERTNRSGSKMGGLVIIAVGVVFLLNRLDMGVPHWLVSWPMIPIVVGLYIGARHSFKNFAWVIPIIVGSAFLIDQHMGISIHEFIWPVVVIFIGLVMVLKPRYKRKDDYWHQPTYSSEDYMDSVTIFGNIKKNIITKEFKGGEAVAVFGGTELNFSQADIQGKIVLDLTMVFGGIKLIVPPHWKIQTEDMVAIFGGIEDKRPLQRDSILETEKTLVIKGTCLFGGIDIKSY